MKKNLLLIPFLVGFLISLFPVESQAQFTTIDFNTGLIDNQNLGKSYPSEGFTFAVNLHVENPRQIVAKLGLGFGGSFTLWDNNPDVGALTRWTITRDGGAEFQFRSIYLQDAGFGGSLFGTIQGFKNGLPVGSAKAINFNSSTGGLKDYAGDADFYDVDEIRIEAADINFYLDHFTYGPVFVPVDTDPTQVTSISVQGNPGPFATSVTFGVNFSKTAQQVSTDDFQLTTTGTAAGTIASITGSGATYTVTVNNVSGEGTLRLDLKAGTNITNANGNAGTAAFTSGSLHTLSACAPETFESAAILDGATSFSSNGRSFTLGTGFEIESQNGFGAVNPGGLGNSHKYIKNNNTAGTFSLSGAQDFTMSTIDIFLSDLSAENNPTGVGSLTIRGKKGGSVLYTITKTSGFPTTTAVNGGFFTINFATSGTGNYRNVNIDQLEFTIADGFVELLLDNFNFCQAAPDIDNLAPKVISSIPDGTAFSTATSVDFTVVFDENAFNVSADDFAINATGSVAGTISNVSGSGSIYTVTVSGITGEGSLKVNLSASNDIRDALNNSPSPAFAAGQEHLVGSCAVETFEDETDGTTSFTGNGMDFSLLGNWKINQETSIGINNSGTNTINTGIGPYSIVSDDGLITVSKLALYLSSLASGAEPTNNGSVTIKGFKSDVEQFSLTKSSGFPTNFSQNNGYSFVDFATEGGNNADKLIDRLEITLGGSFVYFNLENFEWCADKVAPSGYTVMIDQDLIDAGNQTAASFTFADAEIGTVYNYTFSSSGGGTNVTGSGTVASANQQITGIDLSGLGDGTLTLSVTLTDESSNVGTAAEDTSTKMLNAVPVATPPLAPVVEEDSAPVALTGMGVTDGEGDDQTLSFTITGGILTLGTDEITFGGGGNGSAAFTASGTLDAINAALAVATYTPASDLYGSNVGGISFTANDGTATSAAASVTFDIAGVNDDPTITGLPAAITVVEDSSDDEFNISSAVIGDIDAEDGQLSLVLTATGGIFDVAAGTGVTINGHLTSQLTLTGNLVDLNNYIQIPSNIYFSPSANLNGNSAGSVEISINDNGNTGSGGGTTLLAGTVAVNITPVNDAPTVAIPISDQNATQDVDFSFTFDENTFEDVDEGDVLTYTAGLNGGGDLPDWLDFDGATRTFSGTPSNGDVGSVDIDVIADDGNGGSVTDTFTLTVDNVNDAPTDLSLDNDAVSENEPVGTVIGAFTATDVDAGETFTYTLVSGEGDTDNASFSIAGDELHTAVELDYETQDSYSVRVRVTDSGELFFEKTFSISVTDVNDAPSDIGLNTTTVAENGPIGTGIGIFTATDDDTGETFTYSLVSGTGDEDNASFSIVGDELHTAVELDYETQDSYSILVQVADSGGLTFEKIFIISVTDVNEGPSDIDLSTTTVAENEPIGTGVGTFSAVDEDTGETFTYSLVSGTGDEDNASFSVVGDELHTAVELDYETQDSYSIRVQVEDQGGLTFEKTFTILVTNVNEGPSDITLDNNTVAENGPIGTGVGTFSAADEDIGEIFTYSLVSGTGDTDNASFSISGDELRTAVGLDYESKTSYSVRVQVEDQGGLTFEKIFTILVTDINEAPSDIDLSTTIVAENGPIGTAVGIFTATDEDTGETFIYSLVSGAGDTDNASFSIIGNELLTAVELDFEIKDSYSIRVQVADLGGLTFEKSFIISVTDVNDAPSDIALSNNTLDENELTGTLVGTFTATDEDAGESFTYSLVFDAGIPDNASFSISGNELRTAAVLDFEAKSSYVILVRVTDAGGLTFDKIFTLVVTDVNEVPSDILLDNNTVAENESIGTLVGAFSTTDEDLGETFTYSLVGGTGDTDNASFSIAGNELLTAVELDFETKSSYSIRVRVVDSGGLNFEKQFTISVTDVNDIPVLTTSAGTTSFVEVLGNEPVPVVIDGEITVSDPDNPTLASATVSITIGHHPTEDILAFDNDGSTMGNIVGSYDPSLGVLTLTSPVPLASLGEWESALRAVTYSNVSKTPNTNDRTITFVVNDGEDTSSPATKAVSVSDVNDPPTIDAPAFIEVVENVATSLTGISFDDVDAGSAAVGVTFSIPEGKGALLSGITGGITLTIIESRTVILEGTLAAINDYIADGHFKFLNTPDDLDDVPLNVIINDRGNTGGISDPQTANKAVTITVRSTVPRITRVYSPDPDGYYGLGDLIAIHVEFDREVIATEVGDGIGLLLATGVPGRFASYASGSGEETLVFHYTVQPGDENVHLDYLNTGALELAIGSTIQSVEAGIGADLTLPTIGSGGSLSDNNQLIVDGIAPTVVTKDITITLDANGTAVLLPGDIDDSSSDNLTLEGDLVFVVSRTDFDCSDVGLVEVTLTVTDEAGNESTATATVTVVDMTDPTVQTRDIIVALNADGQITITAEMVDDGSDDACGIASLTLSQTDFDCGDIGENMVSLTVTDQAGNSASAEAKVTVMDNTAPVVTTQNIIVYLDATGTVSITPADINDGSTDACGVQSITLSQTDFDCNHVGDNTVTLTVTDVNGNSADADAMVTVVDNIAPVVNTQNITVYLDAAGTVSITAADINDGSTDACGVQSITLSQTDFDCGDIGENTVTLTVTDVNGNSASADATVTVVDNIAPVVTTQNITVFLDATGTVSITPADINDGSTDACGVQSITLSQTDFDCSHVGANTVTLTVTDSNGNSASADATVTVVDNTAPVVNTQNITVYLDAAGTVSITAADINDGSTDACGIQSITLSQTDFDCEDIGENTVTLTVTDVNGNSASAEAIVTVVDNIAPVVTTQNITVFLDAAGTVSITAADINDGSTDACGVQSITLSQTDFDCEDIGENTVTLTVTDVNGNSASADAIVTVVDNTAPVVNTQNITVYLDATGTVSITAADINDGSTDACGIQSITLSQTDFDCEDIGENTVTLTVTDVNGNSASADAIVTVVDNTAPVVNTQNITVYLDATGTVSITAADINDGSTDACGIQSITLSQTVFDCSHVGDNTVTLTVTDSNGNSASADATVTVVDNTAPVVTTQNITVFLDAAGTVNITAADINDGSADACGIQSVTLSQTVFDCSHVGANTVTLTVTDNNGNSASADATVTVVDNMAPVVNTQNITVYLDAAGTVSITAADINDGSADACGIQSITLSQTDFDCADVGDNTVTVTVTDVNGNSASADATVTVVDNTTPVVTTQDITVYLDATGTVSITAADLNDGSTDACGIQSVTLSQTVFDCSHVGANTVTLTVTDVNGNSASADAIVTVVDNTAPVVTTQNITVYLDAAGTVSITAADINDGSADACGIQSVTLSQTVFDCSHVGDNTVTLTVTDNNGYFASVEATVTVVDDTDPVVITKDITVYLDAAGTVSITAADINDGSADACGIQSITLSQTAFDCSHVGNNTVTLTVTDVNGNSASGDATVTVVDNTAPVPVQNVLEAVTDACMLDTLTAPTAGDNCGGVLTASTDAAFPITESTVITWTFTDPSGNQTQQTQQVVIEDSSVPLIAEVPEDFEVILYGRQPYVLPDFTQTALASDNCTLVSFTQSPAPGTAYSQPGTVLITLIAVDSFDNQTEASFTITLSNRLIIGIENPEMLTVPWNIPINSINLPQQVTVSLPNGDTVDLQVNWDTSGYNPIVAGIYQLAGTLQLGDIENPQGFAPNLVILVEDKLPPTDIQLSNTEFAANISTNTAIGTLSTVDAQDNIHTYELVNAQLNDGQYFRIEGDALYWNTGEPLPGQTGFTIIVQSTDRVGNSIEKTFVLTRSRMPIEQVQIFNSFTPNGDGVNDTWGVPDLQYFQGGRIQVFDRSGQRIFYTESPAERWDGTFEGREMPVGSYYWILESRETGEIRRGVLTLLRN